VYGHIAKKMRIAKRTTNVSMSNVLQKNVREQDHVKGIKIVMETFVFPSQSNVKMIRPAQRMNCVHHFITIVEKYAEKLVIVSLLKFALIKTIARKRVVTKILIAKEIMNALRIVALIFSATLKKTAKTRNMTVSKVDVMKLNA
jgi:predicted DNA binding protein